MDISVGDVYSTVLEPKRSIVGLAAIREVCRAKPSGYQFAPKYKRGLWDGYISLMGSFNKFPTGLLGLVTETLNRRRIPYQLLNSHKCAKEPAIDPDCLAGVHLRDYQVDATVRLLQAGRGVAKMATNSGKTEVMAAIIRALHFPKTLVLLRRKELMYQTAARFETRLNIKVGKIGDGIYDPKKVTVAMVQTLGKYADAFGVGIELVMVDECHTASSDQMMDVLFKIPGSYRYGFSGTPLKYDVLADMKLVALTGPVVVDVTNSYLIQQGYSAIPLVNIDKVGAKKDALWWEAKYPDAYNGLIVENRARNLLVKRRALGASGTVLVLVNRLDHGAALAKAIRGGVFVHGSDTTEYRQLVLKAMAGESGIFIASPIFDEGIDVPSVSTLILAGGGKSQVKLLQRIGRGLRKKAGDNVLRIYDFMDNANKYLYRHSLQRMDIYESEGFDVVFDTQTQTPVGMPIRERS